MDFQNPIESHDPFNRSEIYHRLIHESSQIPGDSGDKIETGEDSIPWLNPKLIKEGQDFVNRYFLSINLSSIGTLMVGLGLKTVSTILFRNENFAGVSQAMIRFVETGEHMNAWYESDILQQSGKGYKDIQIIRKMHALALKRCTTMSMANSNGQNQDFIPNESGMENKIEKENFLKALKIDLEVVDSKGEDSLEHLMTYNPKVLMSQYDLAITQFGFFGFVVLAPKSLGIKDTKGMDGFIHLWAVLGKLLGIEDRFNLALYPDKILYKRIYDKVVIPCLMKSDLNAINAQFAFGEAIGNLLILSSPKSFIYFGMSSKEMIPQFEGKELRKTMSWKDVIILVCMQMTLFLVYHFDTVRELGNRVYRFQSERNRVKIMKMKRNKKYE